jgi:hypothetical protein
MSKIRRFRDAFINALEDLSFFGNESEEEPKLTEIDNLFILNSQFFEMDVSLLGKIHYLSFLCNLYDKSRANYSKVFEEYSSKIKSLLVSLINWSELRKNLKM